MKALIVATALLLTSCHPAIAATFGDWDSSPEFELIDTQVRHEGGQATQVSIHISGETKISAYPAGWDITDKHHEPRYWTEIVKVNGQAVKFKFTRDRAGTTTGEAMTYNGKKYLTTQFWEKSRVYFEFQDGNVGYFSAKGVKAAWSHLKANQAL